MQKNLHIYLISPEPAWDL